MTPTAARTGPPLVGRFAALLALVVVTLVGVRWIVEPDHSRRNLEFMPDMSVSPATESQTVAGALPGGYSQQALVAGVVPRGVTPFRYGPDDAEAQRAGRELSSPFAADDAAAQARGAEVFRIHCVPCHDAAGGGQGTAVLRGMLPPPPLKGINAMQMPDGQMFHVLTLGSGNMPAMRTRLSAADRWAVIRHVRALQTAKAAAPEEATPPQEGAPGETAPGKEENR